ncbi:MAG: DUF2608 domain-containing protein [Alphaproteobacteria bacterium]|nr:DUF2608 domain-containing protein [Alphaproteobacteria bacterium]
MRIYLLLFMLFCVKNSAHCEIIKVSTYEKAASIISTADENTWVIFDVDEVLITFQNPLMPKHVDQLSQYIYAQSNDFNLIDLLYTPYKMKLIHAEWPSLIHSLQSRDIKTIALTKASTGKLSHFENLTDLRYDTLKKFNIHFNRSFPNLEPRTFAKRDSYSSYAPPLFSNGIIYTCGFSKTAHLEEFIKYLKQKPKKIIFIDDQENNTKEMEIFCRKNNIESINIHYTFIEENEKSTFCVEKAQQTFEQLQKDNIFLSSMTPPIFPQQEPALLNLMQIATIDNIQDTPFIDHVEWAKEIYISIQETMENRKKRNSLTQPNISLLHNLFTETKKSTAEQRDFDDISSEPNTKSEENHSEISLPPQEKISAQNILDKFDQRDAKDILTPMLKRIFEFKFGLYEIGSLFLPYSQLQQNEDYKKSDPTFFTEPQNKEQVFKAAYKTYNHIKGNVLFVLGQAPAYLGITIQEIAHTQNDHDTTIINVPFSGCPDYTKKIPEHYQPELSYLNILTHNKESIFRKMLYEHQFNPKLIDSKKIFIVDHSDGHSFETFINLLKRWFDDEQIPHPEMHIIHMGSPTNLNIADIHSQIFLEIDPELLHSFNTLEDNLRIVPRFTALYWRDNYQKLFKQYPKFDAIPLMEQYKKFAREKMSEDILN